jgi:hypothetical protein
VSHLERSIVRRKFSEATNYDGDTFVLFWRTTVAQRVWFSMLKLPNQRRHLPMVRSTRRRPLPAKSLDVGVLMLRERWGAAFY